MQTTESETQIIGTVEVVHTDTGEGRKTSAMAGHDFIAFNWMEGNYSCDCTRSLLFVQAIGEQGDFDYPCQHDAPTYRVRIFDGAQILLFDDTTIEAAPFVHPDHVHFQ